MLLFEVSLKALRNLTLNNLYFSVYNFFLCFRFLKMWHFSTYSSSSLSSLRGTLSRLFWGLHPCHGSGFLLFLLFSDTCTPLLNNAKQDPCVSHSLTPRQNRWQQGEADQMEWKWRKRQGQVDAFHHVSWRSLSTCHEQPNFFT